VTPGRVPASLAFVLLLGGCAALPSMPPAVPGDVVPTAQPTPTISAGDSKLSPDGFDAVERMAVRIRNVGCGEVSTGSGFALTATTLVTNKHVVADSSRLQVSTYDGHDVAVTAASTAGLADLALVRTSEDLPSAPQLANADPAQGDPVTVVGYPLGGQLTLTDGRVIGTTTDPLNSNLGQVLVTDARVEPGSSGSAALDADGKVIGVVYAKNDAGYSFLVPVSTLRAMLADTSSFTPAPTCAG
jgi:S1-C subfamily serine protease